jgi:hypothetical protein
MFPRQWLTKLAQQLATAACQTAFGLPVKRLHHELHFDGGKTIEEAAADRRRQKGRTDV